MVPHTRWDRQPSRMLTGESHGRGYALPKKIDSPPDEVLRRLYLEDGLSENQIAAQFGVSRMPVRRWLKELGITGKLAGRVPPSAEEIVAYVDQDHDEFQAAEHFGYLHVDHMRSAIKRSFAAHGRSWEPEWRTPRPCKGCGTVFTPKQYKQVSYCSAEECQRKSASESMHRSAQRRPRQVRVRLGLNGKDHLEDWRLWPAYATSAMHNNRRNNTAVGWDSRIRAMETSLNRRATELHFAEPEEWTTTWWKWPTYVRQPAHDDLAKARESEWEARICAMRTSHRKGLQSQGLARGRFYTYDTDD